MQDLYPHKTIVPLSRAGICGNMKVNTLARLAWCLDHEQHEVLLDEDVRARAESALRGMLGIAGGWKLPTAEEEKFERDSVDGSGCGCA